MADTNAAGMGAGLKHELEQWQRNVALLYPGVGGKLSPEQEQASRLAGAALILSEKVDRAEREVAQARALQRADRETIRALHQRVEAMLGDPRRERRQSELAWRLVLVAIGCAVAGLGSWVLLAG